MKTRIKLLVLVLFLIGNSYGQTYNPSLHTVSNKPYGLAQSGPLDARSYFYESSYFKYRPYQSTAEVLSYLNQIKYRTGNFPIYINTGGVLLSGSFIGGTISEYWFKDSTGDGSLVEKKSIVVISANDYFDDGGAIKTAQVSIVGNVISGLIDPYTGEPVTYSQVINKPDGTPYSNSDIDGVIIRQKTGLGFYKRNFTGGLNVKWYGAKGDGITSDVTAFNNADKSGYSIVVSSGNYLLDSNVTFSRPMALLAGAIITSSKNIIFNYFSASLQKCLDISGNIQFVNTEKIYPQWFGAMGNAKASGGTIGIGSNQITLTNSNPFAVGDSLYVQGAGTAGSILASKITAITGSVLTLSVTAVTAVTEQGISTVDNTVSLTRFFASARSSANTGKLSANSNSTSGSSLLYIPRGIYSSFDKLNVYNGCIVQGEYGNVQGGAILMQLNISRPLINIVADNFDISGVSTNGGNGNNIFRDVVFKSSHINDNLENSPAVFFQNAWNNHSDTRFEHCIWQGTAGYALGAGFVTQGTATSGTNTLSMVDGSTLRSTGTNVGGSRIIIAGAGVGGADLSTWIVSGGGTNSVVINDTIRTTVTGTNVFPTEDLVNPVYLTKCEFDVCRGGISFDNNVSGEIFIDDLTAYQCVRGAIRKTSRRPFSITWKGGYMYSCGNYNNSINQNYSRSIFITNPIAKDNSQIIINGIKILRDPSGFGGPMLIRNVSLANISNTIIDDVTSTVFFYKVMQLVEVDNINLKDNIIISRSMGDYTNSRLIAISDSAPYKAVQITGNTFINTNASNIDNFIQSDYYLYSAFINNNSFIGNVNAEMNSNIYGNEVRNNSQRLNTIQKNGTGPPTINTWKVGDEIVNLAPTINGTHKWICTTAGTPGTWTAVPVLVAPAVHTHAAADITSGLFETPRLASGTATEGYIVKILSGVPTWRADSIGVVLPLQYLTDAPTITWNISAGASATVTIAGNRTLSLSGLIPNTTEIIKVVQDPVGSKLMTWPVGFRWQGGVAPTLTNTANAADVITCWYDGVSHYCNAMKDFR
jgi:hypothetical protein